MPSITADQPFVHVVVAAIFNLHGQVLIARRPTHVHQGGLWEFPGGKVEPGETWEDALAREVTEELRCRIEVTGWLPGEVPIGDAHTLAVAMASLVDGEPEPVEHDLVRWLGAGELGDVDWLEADRPFLAELRHLLTTLTP
jgi:8-oxo-dGTP diphosphatase